MEKIRKGDVVVVLTGKDKGKTGVVTRRVDADYVTVEGVNVAKKHQRPNPMAGVSIYLKAIDSDILKALTILALWLITLSF